MNRSTETRSMTTSRQTSFLSEVASEDAVIPAGKRAYLQERLRNNLFNFVIAKFLEREEAGFTKARLARRIGYDPARVSRLLGAPGNWTIDTVSDLLVGISAEELVPASQSLLDRPARNFTRPVWLESATLNYIERMQDTATGQGPSVSSNLGGQPVSGALSALTVRNETPRNSLQPIN